MHRCSGHIECISVQAYEVGDRAVVEVKPINDIVSVTATRLDKDVKVFCSIVCSINKTFFVEVNPNVVWLTPEMLASADFDITSNTSWIIK